MNNFDYVILPEAACIVVRYTGAVTLGDVMRASEVVWGDPLYDRSYRVLSDLREATASAMPRDVHALLSFLNRPEVSVGRWAAIFSEPKGTALGFFFRSASALGSRLGVFSTWEGAAEHLEVEVAPSVFARGA